MKTLLLFALLLAPTTASAQYLPGPVYVRPNYQIPQGSTVVIHERRGPLGFLWYRWSEVIPPAVPLPGYAPQYQPPAPQTVQPPIVQPLIVQPQIQGVQQ